MPKTFIAVTLAGDLVVASTATGRVQRVLASTGAPGERWGLPPSSDGRDVYYTRHVRDRCDEVWKVPLTGGRAEKVSRGSDPAISPDNRRLAYTDSENCGDARARVNVRDLRSGKERTWTWRGELIGGVGPATWAPNGRTLLVNECGADSCGPFVVDPSKRSDDLDGPSFGPRKVAGIEATSLSFSFPVVRGRRGTVLFDVDDPGGGEAPKNVFEYDARTGALRELLPDHGQYDVIDADSSGRFLLYFGRTGGLRTWYDGRSIRIGPGYASASW